MLKFKQGILKSLLWVEEHSRKLRKTMEKENRCRTIAKAGLKSIMSAYHTGVPKTDLEYEMYQIAKETYKKLKESDQKEEVPK